MLPTDQFNTSTNHYLCLSGRTVHNEAAVLWANTIHVPTILVCSYSVSSLVNLTALMHNRCVTHTNPPTIFYQYNKNNVVQTLWFKAPGKRMQANEAIEQKGFNCKRVQINSLLERFSHKKCHRRISPVSFSSNSHPVYWGLINQQNPITRFRTVYSHWFSNMCTCQYVRRRMFRTVEKPRGHKTRIPYPM